MRYVFALLIALTALFSLTHLPCAGEPGPVTCHISFENMDFLADDWISRLNVKTSRSASSSSFRESSARASTWALCRFRTILTI